MDMAHNYDPFDYDTNDYDSPEFIEELHRKYKDISVTCPECGGRMEYDGDFLTCVKCDLTLRPEDIERMRW